MKILTLLAALWLCASALAAQAASLRPTVMVEDSVVRLGDLFEDIGPAADIAVTRAPAPGRRAIFDAAWLAQVARAYQIDWRPQTRFDRVVVERAGRTIATAAIVARLGESLGAAGMPAGAEIELAARNVDIAVALDVPATIEVRNLSFERQSGRFSAMLIVGEGHPAAKRVSVTGRAIRTVSLPVLRRPMAPGEIIRNEDIEQARVREEIAHRDVIIDPEKLVGMTPRARLRAGEPIRESDARAPVLIGRNSPVTIVLQAGNMTLTAQGRAAEDGAKGDTIRVMNLQSKKTIEAVVAGPDLVTIQLAGHRAAN